MISHSVCVCVCACVCVCMCECVSECVCACMHSLTHTYINIHPLIIDDELYILGVFAKQTSQDSKHSLC